MELFTGTGRVGIWKNEEDEAVRQPGGSEGRTTDTLHSRGRSISLEHTYMFFSYKSVPASMTGISLVLIHFNLIQILKLDRCLQDNSVYQYLSP